MRTWHKGSGHELPHNQEPFAATACFASAWFSIVVSHAVARPAVIADQVIK
jgi:hypothetical protein